MSLQTPAYTELRCPFGPRKLLAKIRSEGGVVRVSEGNLLELSCRFCTQEARRVARERDLPAPFRILHRYDLAGAYVESVEDQDE